MKNKVQALQGFNKCSFFPLLLSLMRPTKTHNYLQPHAVNLLCPTILQAQLNQCYGVCGPVKGRSSVSASDDVTLVLSDNETLKSALQRFCQTVRLL